MIRQSRLLLAVLAALVATADAGAQEMSSEPFRLTMPVIDGSEVAIPVGVIEPGSALRGYALEPAATALVDYNARLGIRTAANERHIEPFLLIGAAAGSLLGYAVWRRHDRHREPYLRTLAMASGATVGVGVGALVYFIGPRRPSDREPPTPQPPRSDPSRAHR